MEQRNVMMYIYLLLLANSLLLPAALSGRVENGPHKGIVHDFRKLASSARGSSEDYWENLFNSDRPSIVRVVGEHCSACIETAPIYRSIAQRYAGKITCIDINYQDNKELLKKYHIKSLPTFMLIHKNTQHTLKEHSAISRDILIEAIADYFHIRND